MQTISNLINRNFQQYLKFINISNDRISLVEWKSSGSFKNYILDMDFIRENKIEDFFFHINKLGMKIAYIRIKSLIFIIGAEDGIQNQLMEALLECIIKSFYEKDDLVSKLNIDNISNEAFKSFKYEIEETIYNFAKLDLVKVLNVPCKICKQTFTLIIKKNIIENSTSFPAHIVCIHKEHPIVCYVDRDFQVRGTGRVNFTGLV